MDKEESKIDRLQRTLYSRNPGEILKDRRSDVTPIDFDIKKDWGEKPKFDLPVENMIKRNNSFFNKFLLGSILFFALSFAVAVFIFFGGVNMISSNNLDVEVLAPTSVSSGEELSVGLSIINGNRTDLEDVKLYVDYPIGMFSTTDESKQLTHDEISLGVIKKGESSDQNIRGVLFGEKDTVKTINFRIEYKVKGSNAVFSKEKNYDVVIGSSPLLLDVKFPKEINSGQDITLTIDVTSNSSVPLRDTLIKIEYPYGYSYKSSNINPVKDNSIWNLGDLKNGDKKTITVVGTILGQNEEDRSFRISAGTKLPNVYDFDSTLASSLITLGIRKSFFDLSVTNSGDEFPMPGQNSSINIKWQDTLPDKISQNVIEAKISGTAFDRTKVSTGSGGFYRSADDTVIWDQSGMTTLAEILPGQGGQVSISIASLQNLVTPKLIKNPYIDLDVKMTGQRNGINGGQISSNETFRIKIATQATLTAKSLRETGPFTNSGSVPPHAEKETTYTINWLITNTTNDLKNAVVKAVLPQGMTWKGQVSPSSEKISFDQDTRIITWDIGSILAGTGFTNSSKQIFFKVGFTPSISQIGLSPAILNQSSLNAVDSFTNKQVQVVTGFVSTKYSDPSFSDGKETVVK